MKTTVWEVKYLSSPRVVRYCKKCGIKTEYSSSNLFRVNSHKKTVDIWLIYKCSTCDATWNMSIYSGINRICVDLLKRFMKNDSELACQYAWDIRILKDSGAEIVMPAYEIIGEPIALEDRAKVKIISQYPSKIKVSKILREKLHITRRVFDKLVSQGLIQMESGEDMKNAKVGKGVTVCFSALNDKAENR